MPDTPEPLPEASPSPGGAAPEMDKITHDPERDPTEPPATRRTAEVDRDKAEDKRT